LNLRDRYSLFISNTTNQVQNEKYQLFNLEYSEYIKTEFDYIKHWDLTREKVFMLEPFLNSSPFVILTTSLSRSYFSGGSNDNRPKPYSLGPDAVEQKMILTKQI
jgi:hypothetical protein